MRIKILLESIKPACMLLDNYLNKKLSKQKTGKIEIKLKDLSSKFTAQVVAGAGFGVDGYYWTASTTRKKICLSENLVYLF